MPWKGSNNESLLDVGSLDFIMVSCIFSGPLGSLSAFSQSENIVLLKILLHSEWPKLHRVLAVLSAIRLKTEVG